MSSSNETSPTRGISSWWKQLKKNQNTSNDSFISSSSPPSNIDNVLITRRSNENASTGSLTRPTLSFKSKSSNSVRPSNTNEQLIRQQRDYFMASQNQKFGFGNEVFGVPLEESINVAESLISVPSASPDDFIHYGRIPLLVGKCGSYLKEKGLKVEGIFRVAGASRRVKELQYIFSTPPEYGRKLNWEGYTVHDAASLIRRYLNNLPEPLVPLNLYEEFREPVKSRPRILKHIKARNDTLEKRIRSMHLKQQQTGAGVGESSEPEEKDDSELTPEELELKKQKAAKKQKKIAKDLRNALKEYRLLIDKLPQAQRQLLYYLLDILSMFADNSKENLMPARNLAAIFQPSILSHPDHDLTPEEYALSQAVVELLIEYSKRLLPDVRKYQHTSVSEQAGGADSTTTTNDSMKTRNLPKSYPNSSKNSTTNLLTVRTNNGTRPHSRSLSSAGGVPDAINPKNYTNIVTSSGLTKNKTHSETNLLSEDKPNNHVTDDETSDDELYHPAQTDLPLQSQPHAHPQIQIQDTSSEPNPSPIPMVKATSADAHNITNDKSLFNNTNTATATATTTTNNNNSHNNIRPASPTSSGFHIPHFTRPRPLSMFTGNASNEDLSERESRWSSKINGDDFLNVGGKKDPWYKRLRSSSRSKSEKD